jgi:hypothetical protein
MMNQQATIRSLQMFHKALMLGPILFGVLSFYLVYAGKFSPPMAEQDQLLQLIAIAFSFAAVFIGSSIFKKKVFELRDARQPLTQKAAAFRSVCFIQWALLEGACIFCILCFLLTGNLAFLALAAAVMLWFALSGPSKTKIMLLLRLSESEIENF